MEGGLSQIWSQFGLFTDAEGLWRCGGRLSNAELPYSTKHPIVVITQRSPFYHTSNTESSQKGITQWSEGNSH